MPAGLIDEQRGMRARGGLGGDFSQMQVHRVGVASGHDEGCALTRLGADRAEDIGGGGSLIFGSARTGAAPGPPAGDLVLLADARPHPELVEGRRRTRLLINDALRAPLASAAASGDRSAAAAMQPSRNAFGGLGKIPCSARKATKNSLFGACSVRCEFPVFVGPTICNHLNVVGQATDMITVFSTIEKSGLGKFPASRE